MNLLPFYELYGSFYDDPKYDSRLIFNADETSVNFSDSFQCKAVVKGSDSVSISAGLEHTPSVTLLFCNAAYGAPLTTTLLWPQTSVPQKLQAQQSRQKLARSDTQSSEHKSSRVRFGK